MQEVNFELLQPHTVKLYDLEHKEYEIQDVPACSLLTGNRFDLFAKLYYIRNRQTNRSMACEVYKQHIKAFNPDLKEPGREDKNGYDDFINSFDALIDDLSVNGFDPEKSIIPVDENGVILDGAHRLCALAFVNKQVRIVRFKKVKNNGLFDYKYFLERGLSWKTADIIALEMVQWLPNILIACLWPRMGENKIKKETLNLIDRQYHLCYTKHITTNLESFVRFVAKVYATQTWVGNKANGYAGARDKALNCFDSNRQIAFALFEAKNLEEIIAFKNKIRQRFQYEKHSIHITDNAIETQDIAKIVFNANELQKWNNLSNSLLSKMHDTFNEKMYYFRNVTIINFKVKVAKLLNILR